MPTEPQSKDEDETRTVKSETLCNLEDAEATLSGYVHPDAAQKLVHDFREQQVNGGGEEFDEKLSSLRRRLKNGSKLRLRKRKD